MPDRAFKRNRQSIMKNTPFFEYGLRRYETTQRMIWFLFSIACFLIAYPLAALYLNAHLAVSSAPSSPPQEAFKSVSFWAHQFWIHEEPFGKIIVYLIFVAVVFWAARLSWLILQYGSKYIVESQLVKTLKMMKISSRSPDSSPSEALSKNIEEDSDLKTNYRPSPLELLRQNVRTTPFRFFLHPYQRLRLILNSHQRPLSSEELMDRERRASETDWQIFWSSWLPYRWFFWILPFLALLQTGWIFYKNLEPVLAGQKEIQEALSFLLVSLLPIAQVILVILFLNVGYGISRQLESLYLSNIDALFYDRLLSRLPFQSSDTIVLLKVLKQNFQEMQQALQRIERLMENQNALPIEEKRVIEKVK